MLEKDSLLFLLINKIILACLFLFPCALFASSKQNMPVNIDTSWSVVESIPLWLTTIIATLIVALVFSLCIWKIRKLKKALRVSEERFQLAMDTSEEGLWDWNLETDEVYISPGYPEMLGYQQNELEYSQFTWQNLLHPDDKEQAVTIAKTALAKCSEHYEHEFRLRHKLGHYINIYSKGSIISINDNGKATRVVGTHQNITQRKIAEQKLKESEQQFSSLIHNIPSTFYQYEFKNDWSIFFITNAIESISGFPAKDFISKKCSLTNITHPDDQEQVLESIMDAIKNRQPYTLDYRIIHQDQSIRWVHEKGISIYDDNNQPLYLQGAILDVTKNKLIEIELAKAKQVAENTSQYKSDFLSNMSHEIRTPMNAVIGLGHLVLKTDLNEKQRDYILKIQNASQSLLTIINDILDFSKIEADKLFLESVNFQLQTIFDNLGDLFHFECEDKNIELKFDFNPKIPTTLVGDPTRVSQILINLCSNAVKFTDQGEIKISVHPVEILENKAILKFTVVDTGCGIAANEQNMLFDSFSQADASTTRFHGGTGLGLAICKKLVAMMNGVIGIESELGQGSTFFFFAEFGLDPQNKIFNHQTLPDLKGLRVLVVDDNDAARQILRDQLASLSFKVITVSSANKAYSALQTAEKPYDLVLMDLSMPGTNGLDAIKYIKSNINFTKSPAFILVTAYSQKEVAEESKNIALDGFIVKPSTPSSLLDAINKALKPNLEKTTQLVNSEQNNLQGFVLLVEDNEINQQVAEELLKSYGLEVEIASSGQEAINKITHFATKDKAFDAVLMDIQMPGMDGLQATKKIRSDIQFKDLPIMAMTAHAMVGDKEKSLNAGMNEHITKPIDPSELYNTLKRWLICTESQTSSNTIDQSLDDMTPLPDYSDHLDLNWGLKRVGGNRTLFNKLLKEFYQDHHQDIEQLQQAFKNKQIENAKRIIHTIKGVAGNIGAHQLQKRSTALENCVDSQQDHAASLVLFSDEFDTLMNELDQFQSKQQLLNNTHDKLSNKQLSLQIEKLYQLLNEGDPDAINILNTIQDDLHKKLAKHRDNLQQAIEDYDFEHAITILKEISKRLNVALG